MNRPLDDRRAAIFAILSIHGEAAGQCPEYLHHMELPDLPDIVPA
jgi:hypothetical protein